MNKLLSWTVGSFFRTLGRIICYLAIGALLVFVAQSNDFHFPSWLLIRANASTFQNTWISGVQWNENHGSWSSINQTADGYWSKQVTLNGYNNFGLKFANTVNVPSGASKFNLNLKAKILSQNGIDIQDNQYTCTISKTLHQYDVTTVNDYEWEYKSFTCASQTMTGTYEVKEVSIAVFYWYGDNLDLYAPCYAKSSSSDYLSYECPVVSSNVSGLRIFASGNNTNASLGFTPFISWEIDGTQSIINAQNQNTNAINNQTQQQAQQHQETMNASTEDAEDEAEGFFDDFDVPDVGGLSAIITAPLNTINSLLSSTCTSLVLPLPFINQNLTLPCMSTIYNQHFGAFFILYQTIILAIVSYRCIRSIYFDIHGFTNPNDDRIEVMDL